MFRGIRSLSRKGARDSTDALVRRYCTDPQVSFGEACLRPAASRAAFEAAGKDHFGPVHPAIDRVSAEHGPVDKARIGDAGAESPGVHRYIRARVTRDIAVGTDADDLELAVSVDIGNSRRVEECIAS